MKFKGKGIIISFLLGLANLFRGPRFFKLKTILYKQAGIKIGCNTKIVGPIYKTPASKLTIGDNCWIGAKLILYGDGSVILKNNIDIAPQVTFFTGSHFIGNKDRRAGVGINLNYTIMSGCWICGDVSFINGVTVSSGTVVGAKSLVSKDLESNALYYGIPIKKIRSLEVMSHDK